MNITRRELCQLGVTLPFIPHFNFYDTNKEYTVYKVVFKHSTDYMSSCWYTPKYCIEYQLDTWIKPKIGKIFCFADINYAKEYATRSRGFRIYKGKGKNPSKITYYILSHMTGIQYIQPYWENQLHLIPEDELVEAVKGTIAVSEIKLLERIEK